MTTKIILHIGMYKTGTTSIQNSLYGDRIYLKENNFILYPSTGLYGKDGVGMRHGPLVWMFDKDKEDWKTKLINPLIEEIQKSNANTIILSYEGWSSSWAWPALEALIQEFKFANYNNIEIIGYIRNFDKFSVSYYREFVRHRGLVENFSSFIKTFKGIDYASMIKKMHILSNNVNIYSFENFTDIGKHFYSIVGIGDIYKVSLKDNVGFSALDAEITRQLNLSNQPLTLLYKIKKYIIENGLQIDEKKFSEVKASELIHIERHVFELNKLKIFSSDEMAKLFEINQKSKINIELLSPIIKYLVQIYSSK